MFQSPFYHATIERISIAFANMFNEIAIAREDGTKIVVPISYGNREAWWIKSKVNKDDPTRLDSTASLPRMGFSFSGIRPDQTRQTSRKIRLSRTTELLGVRKRVEQWNRVPYTCNFSLSIIAKNKRDALQIVEQILPYFAPSISVTIKDRRNQDDIQDIKFTLLGVDETDTAVGETQTNRRLIEYELAFDCEFYLYGPISEAKLIKKVLIDTGLVEGKIFETYQVTPDPPDAVPPDPYTYNELTIEYN